MEKKIIEGQNKNIMFLKPFLNNVCSVAGCIILLKEATREHHCHERGVPALEQCLGLCHVKFASTWMARLRVSQKPIPQSITLPPLACHCPTVHSGAITFLGKWHTTSVGSQLAFIALMHRLSLGAQHPVAVLCFVPPRTTVGKFSPLLSGNNQQDTLTQSPCHNNLTLVKVGQIFIPAYFSCIQHIDYENWLFA